MRWFHSPIRRVVVLVLAAVCAAVPAALPIAARAATDCSCRMTADGRCIRNPECPPQKWQRAYHRHQGGFAGSGSTTSARPASRPSIAPVNPGSPPRPVVVSTGQTLRILDTGYAHLTALGKEQPGYGLYSYAILPSASTRANAFLTEMFKQVGDIASRPAPRQQLNILYLPMQGDKQMQFTVLQKTDGQTPEKLGASYASTYYSYDTAQALLYHMCNPPHDSVKDICQGDMSRGPYVFSYASPASKMESVPPPFLFVDLSDVHEKAFGEVLSAFKEQVKREDVSDRARIDTLRLRLLTITLTAADWVSPVQKALADIVRSAGGEDKK